MTTSSSSTYSPDIYYKLDEIVRSVKYVRARLPFRQQGDTLSDIEMTLSTIEWLAKEIAYLLPDDPTGEPPLPSARVEIEASKPVTAENPHWEPEGVYVATP